MRRFFCFLGGSRLPPWYNLPILKSRVRLRALQSLKSHAINAKLVTLFTAASIRKIRGWWPRCGIYPGRRGGRLPPYSFVPSPFLLLSLPLFLRFPNPILTARNYNVARKNSPYIKEQEHSQGCPLKYFWGRPMFHCAIGIDANGYTAYMNKMDRSSMGRHNMGHFFPLPSSGL